MLNVSVVLYRPNWEQVTSLTETLLGFQGVEHVYWVDNSPKEAAHLPLSSDKLVYIFNDKNLGYGAAHNIAIRESVYDDVPFHLVLNSDIQVDVQSLAEMLAFMQQHPEVGSLMPHVIYPNGQTQFLCKLLPTPLDVFGRRFLPKRWMEKRNARYELRASGYDRLMNVPYLSGCFMLLRTQAVLKARLFDERFFMYPEDIDLTRRIHRDYLTVYYPFVTITHNHEQSSYHSLRMLVVHVVNMCRYFNKWGWFCDRERRLFNQVACETYLPK